MERWKKTVRGHDNRSLWQFLIGLTKIMQIFTRLTGLYKYKIFSTYPIARAVKYIILYPLLYILLYKSVT